MEKIDIKNGKFVKIVRTETEIENLRLYLTLLTKNIGGACILRNNGYTLFYERYGSEVKECITCEHALSYLGINLTDEEWETLESYAKKNTVYFKGSVVKNKLSVQIYENGSAFKETFSSFGDAVKFAATTVIGSGYNK